MARVDIKNLTPDPAERCARLGTPSDSPLPLEFELDNLLRESLSPLYLIERVRAKVSGEKITLGKISCVSGALSRVLEGAEYAYILVATLGFGADRRIARATAESTSCGFITDALADCYIESLADYVSREIITPELSSGEELGRRFSPGYADLALGLSKDIIDMTGASARLGIRFTESGLMTPQKSITAVIPIYKK